METLKQAWREQFGCAKSWLKVHDFRYMVLADNAYAVREVCTRCHQQRA